jgi:IS4 transposase
MRAGKPMVEAALASAGRYRKVRDNLEVKELAIGDGEARVRYVLVRNPERARRDRAEREAIIRTLEEELSRLKETKGEAHSKAACALISHKAYGRYLKTGKSGNPVLDKKRIAADERLDGKYLIRTSDDTLSAEDVALGYKQLSEVEAAFRSLKHTLDIRPVNHRKSERIKSHVLLCWLALLLVRVAETRGGDTWRNIRNELDRMHLGIFSGPDGLLKQRTETTPAQRRIFSALDIPEPPLITEISPKKAKKRTE